MRIQLTLRVQISINEYAHQTPWTAMKNLKHWKSYITFLSMVFPFKRTLTPSRNLSVMGFQYLNIGFTDSLFSTLTTSVISKSREKNIFPVINENDLKFSQKIDLREALDSLLEEPFNGVIGILRFIDRYPIIRDFKSYDRILQLCIEFKASAEGKRVHAHMIRAGYDPGTYLWNRLMTLYTQSGKVEDAREVFDKMPERNTFAWNIMISAYAGRGKLQAAHKLFDKMPERDVVSWNAMIAGYGQNGQGEEAIRLFGEMQRAGMKPNQRSFTSAISMCGQLCALEQGKQIHGYVVRTGFESDTYLLNAMIDMYCKCESMESASQLFEENPERDIVSWTAMMAGYSQSGNAEEALKLFLQMRKMGIEPDVVLFPIVLSASANLTALEYGKQVHGYIIRAGTESNVFVGSALVHMYGKCGNSGDAKVVFDNMDERNVVSWNTIISGYAQNGPAKEALKLFEQMIQAGLKPNHVTFIGVLTACFHQGLVDEGSSYFVSMTQDYCIAPRQDHYACMVDLYSRAGHLNEAEKLINHMPFEPDAVIWGALLSACRVYKNVELGRHAAEQLFKLEPQRAGPYILLSNIYASAGRWDEVTKVRNQMRYKGVKKEPGCSWVELGNKVHTFLSEDRSHPQAEEIYALLEEVAGKMKVAGYVPDMNFVLHDVEEENKEESLLYHSEKLAVAFSLIKAPAGAVIRIFKNLRVCGDCHTTMKFISTIVRTEIVVRDSNRFHHFVDGVCSCGDYW